VVNREQARTILWGLHTCPGDEERRAAAIDVVIDLWAGLGEQQRWDVDDRVPTPVSVAAELEGLRTERDRIRNDWRRIEKLVGREFTSPESVIDRVAYLVERIENREDT
jgi:hypothetical protein